MAEKFLFEHLLPWSGFISILYLLLGSKKEVKVSMVAGWTIMAILLFFK